MIYGEFSDSNTQKRKRVKMGKNQVKEWQVEWLDVAALTPYAKNPRKNDNTVPYLKNSIQRFGFKVPLVIGKDGTVVTGHTRLKAALELGMNRVPCVRADDLTDEQIKAFRLVDNKIQELSGWDFTALEEEFAALGDAFDMGDFGFTDDTGTPSDDFFEDSDESKDKDEEPKTKTVICPHCGGTVEVEI
jgi:site-specific DNA-methyltransferase (adenine-specific)